MHATEKELQSVVDYCQKNEIKSGWFGFLKKSYDTYVVLVYAYKKLKPWPKPRIHLAMYLRPDEEKVYWSYNVTMRYCAGYSYDFNATGGHLTDSDQFTGFNEVGKWKTNPFIEPANDWDAVIREGTPSLQYVNDMTSLLLTYFPHNLMTGINTLLQFPRQVEVLQKLNLTGLVSNRSILKTDPRQLKTWIAYSKATDGRIPYTDIPTIKWNIAQGIAPKNAYASKDKFTILAIRKCLGEDTTIADAIEVFHYLRSKFGHVYDYHVNEYSGYIELRKKLKLEIKTHSARFPSDLETSYNYLNQSLTKAKKKEERRVLSTMKTFYKHLDAMASITDGTYSVIHPRTQNQFVKLGNEMHNCVGSMGYYDAQLHGKCAIFGIKKNGKLYACLELIRSQGKTVISQLYLKDNKICDKATRSFVQKTLVKKVYIPIDRYIES